MKSYHYRVLMTLLAALPLFVTSCNENVDKEMKGDLLVQAANKVLGMTKEEADEYLKKNSFITVAEPDYYSGGYVRGDKHTISSGSIVYSEWLKLYIDENKIVSVSGEKFNESLSDAVTYFRRMSKDSWKIMSPLLRWTAGIQSSAGFENYVYSKEAIEGVTVKDRSDYEKALKEDFSEIRLVSEDYIQGEEPDKAPDKELYLQLDNDLNGELVMISFSLGDYYPPLPCSPAYRALYRLPSSVNCDPIE